MRRLGASGFANFDMESGQLESGALLEMEEREVPDKLALLVNTSGSSGQPKLAAWSRQGVDFQSQAISSTLAPFLPDCPHWVAQIPLSTSYGLSVFLAAYYERQSLHLIEPDFLDHNYWDYLRKLDNLVLPVVPTMLRMLKEYRLQSRFSGNCALLTTAGGAVSDDQWRWLVEDSVMQNVPVSIMYGQTEATSRISVLPPTHVRSKRGASGFPLPGLDLSISAREAGGVGEILVKGPSVFLGYVADAADFGALEAPAILHTGDLGFLDQDGILHVVGRMDRSVKIRDFRVNLDVLEGEIGSLIGAEVALLGTDSHLHVFVVGEEEKSQLHNHLGQRFRHLGIRCHSVMEIPRLPSGKTDYQALRDKWI